jgi:putative ABC transport system ATP-binding protein
VIKLERVSRTYEIGGSPLHALQSLDLEIPDGAYVAVMGPSGSGKSTLLNIIGCLDRPTSGSFVLDGKEVAKLGEAELSMVRRHRIGFVFQTFHLVPRLSAAANVELPMIFAGIERAERRERAARALAAVDLSDRAGHRPDQLSGGERQRVAIARAVVMGPSIVLADEPTGNLDTKAGDEVIRLLERMNRDDGRTLIVVTHNPAVGQRARMRIRLMDGRLAEVSEG